MELKTCKHIYDSGYHCSSAAAKDRDYCVYHLRYRGRLMRAAQTRARNQRFDLCLPPLENMQAVQTALSQLAEARAADMIDPKRAHELHSVLRSAAGNFRHPDAWTANVHTTDQPATCPVSYEEFEAEYGLPEGINVSVPPEVAFPPEPVGAPSSSPGFGDRVGSVSSDLSSRAQAAASAAGVEGPLSPLNRPGGDRVGTFPRLDREPLIPIIPAPYVRDYMAEAEAALFETTPEQIELHEILQTEGYKAMERRAQEHQRNSDRKKRRKLFRANYERYAAEAKLKNIQRAAEKLIADRLAAEKAAAKKLATEQEAAQNSQSAAISPASEGPASGWPIPPAVGGVGTFSDPSKKPVASVSSTGEELQKGAQSIA